MQPMQLSAKHELAALVTPAMARSDKLHLLDVISRQCDQRRNPRVQRLLRHSALPVEKWLQNLNLKRLPAKAARQPRTLLDGSFLDRKENIFLVFGNPGSRKCQEITTTVPRGSITGTSPGGGPQRQAF